MVENVSTNSPKPKIAWPLVLRRLLNVAGPVAAIALTVSSAIMAKELGANPPLLASVATVRADRAERAGEASPVSFVMQGDAQGVEAEPESDGVASVAPEAAVSLTPPDDLDPATRQLATDPNVRWFDGRPVRPARIMTMVVTAYSPDAKSCGRYADGMTATLHSVATNGFALVAADPTILRYGAMLTVPGYDQNRIVPVLDCGSDIKGRRLDVIFPTDAQARKWGRQTLKVVVWEYADGKAAPNPRRLR